MNYYVANEDYDLGCADSAMADVDLSNCLPSCFSVVTTENLKAGGKKCLTNIVINVTVATGMIKTTLIDGSAVTFVSASGVINGSSAQNTSNQQKLILADENINGLTVGSYTGNGSVGTLTVIGVNASSGASVTDVCKVWIKSAGQNVVRCA